MIAERSSKVSLYFVYYCMKIYPFLQNRSLYGGFSSEVASFKCNASNRRLVFLLFLFFSFFSPLSRRLISYHKVPLMIHKLLLLHPLCPLKVVISNGRRCVEFETDIIDKLEVIKLFLSVFTSMIEVNLCPYCCCLRMGWLAARLLLLSLFFFFFLFLKNLNLHSE